MQQVQLFEQSADFAFDLGITGLLGPPSRDEDEVMASRNSRSFLNENGPDETADMVPLVGFARLLGSD